MTAVGRVDDFDSRWYVDPANPDLRFESVTNIISATQSKPWLTPWASKIAAQYAVEKHDAIGLAIAEFGPEAAVDLIKGEAKRRRELKAEIGTHQHDMIEALIKDKPLPSLPDHLVGVEIDGESVDHDAITDGFLNFVEDHEPEFEMAEATVANILHGYAGTLDITATLPKMRAGERRKIIDVKSGAVLDATMGAQLAAYRWADEVWVDEFGNKAPMPRVDGAAILHIRREYDRGYKLIEVPAGEAQFEWFAAMTRVFHMNLDLGSKLQRRVLYVPLPDGSQPLPLLEDVELKCRRALITAGIRDLGTLAATPLRQVASIKGVGPKALEDISRLLASFDLSPAAEGAVA